jgi:hypothetical protein
MEWIEILPKENYMKRADIFVWGRKVTAVTTWVSTVNIPSGADDSGVALAPICLAKVP